MTIRKPYVATLDAMGPYFVALLGLIARIRQEVTGELPTRDTWVADLNTFLETDETLLEEGLSADARHIFDDHFGPEKKKRKQLRFSPRLETLNTNPRILVEFIDWWLLGKAPQFQNAYAKQLLKAVDVEDSVFKLLSDAQRDGTPVDIFMQDITIELAKRRSRWAPTLRLFEWPSIRTGFASYERVARTDVRGLYLIVRESRGWDNHDDEAPIRLVRDLLWIRGLATDRSDDKDFEGLGRYYSAFNAVIYNLRTGAVAAQWNRFQGPPIASQDRDHLEIEVASPSLSTVTGNLPAFALMTAHARGTNNVGVWKGLILRIESDSKDWGDIAGVEPELEMFCQNGGELEDTDTEALINHLMERGIVGEFEEDDASPESASIFFRRLLSSQHVDGYEARLRERLKLAVSGSADPLEAIIGNWHMIEPTQIVLPPADDASIPPEMASYARDRLFGRYVFGPDQVARRQLEAAVTEND